MPMLTLPHNILFSSPALLAIVPGVLGGLT